MRLGRAVVFGPVLDGGDRKVGQARALAVKAERPDAGARMGGQAGAVGVPAALDDGDFGLGGVVLVFHARGARGLAGAQFFEDGVADEDLLAKRGFELFTRDVAGAQQHRVLADKRDDGGFDPDRTVAAVQNQRQAAVHIGEGVGGVGRAGLARKVGRRRGEGDAGRADDRLHDRVGRHAHADGVQPGAGDAGDFGPARQHHGQRAGPVGRGELARARRHFGHDAVQHFHAADVHDEGVILRAALGGEYFFDRRAVARIGGDAVDRLGRQRDKLAAAQKPGGQRDALFVDG